MGFINDAINYTRGPHWVHNVRGRIDSIEANFHELEKRAAMSCMLALGEQLERAAEALAAVSRQLFDKADEVRRECTPRRMGAMVVVELGERERGTWQVAPDVWRIQVAPGGVGSFRSAICNIVANARQHAMVGSSIDCSMRLEDRAITVSVLNRGKLGNGARGGLNVIDEDARRLGGTFSLEEQTDTEGERVSATLRLPVIDVDGVRTIGPATADDP
jgi:hypothetical protein